MTTVIVLIILFVILLTLPLAVSFIYYAASKGKVMKINQDILRDQRYFAHSFSGMIERSLPTAEDNKIKLSRTEHYDDAEAVRRRVHQSTVENLVIETKDSYVSPKHVKYYEKEIYAAGDAASRNIFRHNRTGSDDGAIPNGHTRQDGCFFPDPDIVSDDDRPFRDQRPFQRCDVQHVRIRLAM